MNHLTGCVHPDREFIMKRTLKIGLSARLAHPRPGGKGLESKTLQYLEQSIAHWIMAHGAIALAWTFFRRRSAREVLFPWLASMGALGLAFLRWAGTALNQLLYHQMDWIGPPTAASGAICPMHGPLVPPENRPSVTSATLA